MKDKEPYEWALETINKLKAKLEVVESQLAAIKTAIMISKGDDAKAGSLIRQLLAAKP